MIWNDEVLFLHMPKTGGMSLTAYLLENLAGPVRFTADVMPRVKPHRAKFIEGRRHETMADAESYFTYRGRSIEDFEAIFVVIRNPYDLEVSRFHYLQAGHKGDAGPAQDLALAGDYEKYLREAPFFGANPPRLDRYMRLGSVVPESLRVLRHEHLADDFDEMIGPHLRHDAPKKLPRLNASKRADNYRQYYNAVTEELCYQRHRFFFDKSFYRRDRTLSGECAFPASVPREFGKNALPLTDEQGAKKARAICEIAADIAPADRSPDVVEVGCSLEVSAPIAAGTIAAASFTGYDVDQNFVDFMNDETGDRLTFAPIGSFPPAPDSVDVVWMLRPGLNELPDNLDRLLGTSVGALRPGGSVVLRFIAIDAEAAAADGSTVAPFHVATVADRPIVSYTEAELRRRLAAHGLEPGKVYGDAGDPTRVITARRV